MRNRVRWSAHTRNGRCPTTSASRSWGPVSEISTTVGYTPVPPGVVTGAGELHPVGLELDRYGRIR